LSPGPRNARPSATGTAASSYAAPSPTRWRRKSDDGDDSRGESARSKKSRRAGPNLPQTAALRHRAAFCRPRLLELSVPRQPKFATSRGTYEAARPNLGGSADRCVPLANVGKAASNPCAAFSSVAKEAARYPRHFSLFLRSPRQVTLGPPSTRAGAILVVEAQRAEIDEESSDARAAPRDLICRARFFCCSAAREGFCDVAPLGNSNLASQRRARDRRSPRRGIAAPTQLCDPATRYHRSLTLLSFVGCFLLSPITNFPRFFQFSSSLATAARESPSSKRLNATIAPDSSVPQPSALSSKLSGPNGAGRHLWRNPRPRTSKHPPPPPRFLPLAQIATPLSPPSFTGREGERRVKAAHHPSRRIAEGAGWEQSSRTYSLLVLTGRISSRPAPARPAICAKPRRRSRLVPVELQACASSPREPRWRPRPTRRGNRRGLRAIGPGAPRD